VATKITYRTIESRANCFVKPELSAPGSAFDDGDESGRGHKPPRTPRALHSAAAPRIAHWATASTSGAVVSARWECEARPPKWPTVGPPRAKTLQRVLASLHAPGVTARVSELPTRRTGPSRRPRQGA